MPTKKHYERLRFFRFEAVVIRVFCLKIAYGSYGRLYASTAFHIFFKLYLIYLLEETFGSIQLSANDMM